MSALRVYPDAVSTVMRMLAAAAVAAGLLAACGGSPSAGGGQPQGSIKLTMTEFKFEPSSVTVPHGKAVFYLVNAGTVSHDMIVRDSSGSRIAHSELISAGEASVLTIDDLGAGTYTYFCDQPGHEASGMKGTLTVT